MKQWLPHYENYCFISYSSVWGQFYLHLLLYHHINLVMLEVKNTVTCYPKLFFFINSSIYMNTLIVNCKWYGAGSVYLRLSVVFFCVVWVLAFRTPACFLRHLLGPRRHPWLALRYPFINRPDNTPTFSQFTSFLHSLKGSRLWIVTHCDLDDFSH